MLGFIQRLTKKLVLITETDFESVDCKIERYLKKIIDYYADVQTLLKTANSPNLRHTFEAEMEVISVDIETETYTTSNYQWLERRHFSNARRKK